jgi:hypothetical protein
MSTLSIVIQYSASILSQHLGQEKEIKEIQTEKEEVKLSLFADDMILYLKDPKDYTKKTKKPKKPSNLDMINTVSIITEYKINIKKPVAFLYTNNERLRKKSGI